MTKKNPDYFEALIFIRDSGSSQGHRLDTFEFAFERDGKIGRIRRRAALPSDLLEALQLPDNSRCRRQFLGPKRSKIENLVREYWSLPSIGS